MNKQSSLPWIIASVLVLVAAFIRLFVLPAWPINCDSAMYVAAGLQLLEGKHPYVDFIDLNPPLVFYFSAVPALIGKLLAAPQDQAFFASTYAFSVYCWLLSALLLLRRRGKDYFLVGPMLLSFAVFTLAVTEWGEFGQRQHWMTLALVPFLLCRWQRFNEISVPPTLATIVGLTFGTFLAPIPQYAIIPAACELYFLIRSKRLMPLFKPEMVSAAVAASVLLVASNLLLPPDSREAFVHRWLPLIIRDYSAYNGDFDTMTRFPFLIGCIPLFLLGLWFGRFSKHKLSHVMLIFCLSAYASMLIQMKGWWNHYIPFLCATIMFLCVQLTFHFRWRKKNNSMGLHLFETAFLLTLCLLPSVLIREHQQYKHEELELILRKTQPSQSVAIVSTAVPDIYPTMLKANRPNAMRYLFLFPIEMLDWEYHTTRDAARKTESLKEENAVIAELLDDIYSRKPALVLLPVPKEEVKEASMYYRLKERGLMPEFLENYEADGTCRARNCQFYVYKLRARTTK